MMMMMTVVVVVVDSSKEREQKNFIMTAPIMRGLRCCRKKGDDNEEKIMQI